jgi:hypothetical protein
MPFGGYAAKLPTDQTFFSDSCLQVMHNSLGINQMMGGGFTADEAGRFNNAGIYVYPWGTWPLKPQQRYSHTTYYICEAEDDYSDFKFETRNGTVQDSFLVYSGSDYMLDGLYFREENRAWMLGDFQKKFFPYLKMAVDTAGTDSSTLVGIFYVINMEDSTADSVRFADSVFVRDLPADHDTLLSLTNDWEASITYPFDYYFVLEDSTSKKAPKIKFRFKALGNCTIYVDYFKVHSEFGKMLVELGEFNTAIKDTVGDADFDQKILGWHLKDEPRPGNYRPWGYIDRLIEDTTAVWTEPVRGASNFWQSAGGPDLRGLNDFIRFGHPNRVWSDPYCFYGGFGGWRTTKYAGYFTQGPPYEWGLQFELNSSLVRQCDSLRAALSRFGMEDSSWMFIPQYFAGRDSTISEDTTWIWRFPTRAEMICETFIGLCYRPMGIMFFKYDQNWDYTKNSGTRGLVNDDGSHHYMYDVVMNDINPYLKAIDSTFLSLTWKGTYVVSDSSGLGFEPPDTAFVDTVYAISNSSDPNPDLGWFQVGEFTAGSDKYILLVNRACSQGENDPTPAPSVTATVKFNTTYLGLGNYVYIIDIADSIFFQSYEPDSFWADTTYSAALNGTIPFTTVLGPGEGRLFKIVQTSSIALKDTLSNPGFSYQGSIKITGDVIIPSGSTFKVKGPAKFRIAQCDSSSHGGLDSTLVEIVCDGRMQFVGTESDSIYFTELYDCESGLPLEIIDPGDWYGIIDKSTDRDTLSYCVIKWAYKGFFANSNSNAVLRHCNISKNELASIYLEYTNGTKTWIDTCLISENDNGGIYAKAAFFVATGNTITKNSKNGVYINLTTTSPSPPRYELAYNNITKGSEYNTNYGVQVSGTTTSKPAVLFEGNTIEDFSTAGVYLYRVEDGDWDNETGTRFIGYNKIESNSKYGLWCQYSDPVIYTEGECASYNSFSYNSMYGIYCSNLSSPKIKRTKLLDNSTSNVTCVGYSSPNLGDTLTFDGLNDFNTVLYDIKVGPGIMAIYAQENYWGDDDPYPDTLDFYPNKTYVVYELYRDYPCTPSGKLEGLTAEIPDQFALYQNYPNPFNPATSISFDLPEVSNVRISVFNILGQRVVVLANEQFNPGQHSVVWDGRNRYGVDVASGVYFYLIETSQFSDAKKMLVLR